MIRLVNHSADLRSEEGGFNDNYLIKLGFSFKRILAWDNFFLIPSYIYDRDQGFFLLILVNFCRNRVRQTAIDDKTLWMYEQKCLLMRSSPLVRASDYHCKHCNALGSNPCMQHPPAQWNLRDSRWSMCWILYMKHMYVSVHSPNAHILCRRILLICSVPFLYYSKWYRVLT